MPLVNSSWFIAGTDTEVGKTHATCALLHAFRRHGQRAVGMKPVAAGTTADGTNDDVIRLLAAGTPGPGAADINPYLFSAPIAPHVAAADCGTRIDAGIIRRSLDALRTATDVVLVEGVGGFRVPLGDDFDTADLAAALGLPVILVVGLKLGCLSHALLTAEAIARRKLLLAGWIANCIDPEMLRPEASIDALRARIPAPCLGVLPHGMPPESAADRLTLPSP